MPIALYQYVRPDPSYTHPFRLRRDNPLSNPGNVERYTPATSGSRTLSRSPQPTRALGRARALGRGPDGRHPHSRTTGPAAATWQLARAVPPDGASTPVDWMASPPSSVAAPRKSTWHGRSPCSTSAFGYLGEASYQARPDNVNLLRMLTCSTSPLRAPGDCRAWRCVLFARILPHAGQQDRF
jgi:hypothetical protein